MKALTVFLSLCFLAVSFYANAKHSCEIKDGRVVCSGDNYYGQCDVPPLKNPRQVVVGGGHTCALDDGGVKCWGFDYYRQCDVPSLRKVLEISAFENTSCAIDESTIGVKRKICWGSNVKIEILFPNLDHFDNIISEIGYQCGFYKGLVECWGKNLGGLLTIPELEAPKRVAVGITHACAFDDSGAKCWGSNQYGQTDVPPLKNPRQIALGIFYTCALDDDRIKCWGKDVVDLAINNSYGNYVIVADQDKFDRIAKDQGTVSNNLSNGLPMFLSYVFKNELRFFYSFDRMFGEKLFKILYPGSKYSKLMTFFHSELKKEMGLIDPEGQYHFLWNKFIYLPFDHDYFKDAGAPSNDEEKGQLLNALVESIKTSLSLMNDEYKQRASNLILKLSTSVDAQSLSEAEEFVTDAGINPYIRPRVKLQMELIRLLGL